MVIIWSLLLICLFAYRCRRNKPVDANSEAPSEGSSTEQPSEIIESHTLPNGQKADLIAQFRDSGLYGTLGGSELDAFHELERRKAELDGTPNFDSEW